MSSGSSPPASRRGFRNSLSRFYDGAKDLLDPSSGSKSRRLSQGGSTLSVPSQSPPNTESMPKTNSSLHLSVPNDDTTNQASRSTPDLSRGISASPTPTSLRAILNNTISKLGSGKPEHDIEKRGSGRSWAKLNTALQSLHKSAQIFPPLQSVIGTLISCLGVIQATVKTRRDYDDLASSLEGLAILLEKHLSKASPISMSDCVANIVRSLEEEVEYISKKKERGITGISRVGGAIEDEEELLRCYRRIETLFHFLQVDASSSIWDITQEHLVNTRLEGLTPAKAANYNSAVPSNVVRGECTENTRTDVLIGMNTWSNDPNAAKVYWLNGMAGTGKTTIACSLSAALAKRKQLGASFFCTRVLDECRDAIRIIPTIAYQLARYSRPFQQALCKVLDNDPDIAKRIIPTQFERLLKEPLLEIRDAIPSNVVVVIDALDECADDSYVRTLLDTLFQHAANLPLKFFVASRPEPEILNKMQSQTQETRSILQLHEIDRSSVQADITRYIWKELAFMSPTKDDVERLAQLSDNLFIYAATTVRYIQFRRKSAGARERLRAVLALKSDSNKMYAELDTLYAAILEGALDDIRLEEAEAGQFQVVLWSSVCVREPVSIQALASLTGLGEETTEEILQSLRSVLHISEPSGLVTTLHASFPDFIFTQERSGRFYCDKQSHSPLLARQCFKILQDELRFNICKLEFSFVLDKEVKDLEERVREHISQKLSYACRYWGDHLSLALPANDLCSLLEDFLSHRLLFWLEVLNLSKAGILGKFILQNTRSWLAPFNDPTLPDIMQLTSDSLDFATMLSSNPVMDSTPHIYISLLPFCHKSSLVITRYWGRMQGLLDVKGTAMERPGSVAVANYDVGMPIESIAVSPDGSVIAFGGGDRNAGMIGLISRHDGTFVIRPFKAHASRIHSIAFSSDGTRIVSGSVDSTICLWNSTDGTLAVGPLKGHTDQVWSVAFSPDGTRVVSGSENTGICLWDARDGTLAVGPLNRTSSVSSVAFSPDGARIVSCGFSGIRIWNAQDGECIAGPFPASGDMMCVAFSPCSTRIISGNGGFNGSISVWNATDGRLVVGPLAGHASGARSVACSSDSTRIVSGSFDRTICVWNVQDGKLLAGPFRGHTDWVTSVAFSPDNAHIISGSVDGTIRIWKAQGKNPSARFGGETGRVASAAFSLDRTRVVFGSLAGIISVWNAQDGELVAGPFKAHTDHIYSVAFSPDGARLVSGSSDRTICVWDAKAGTLVAGPITGHTGRVTSVAFSPADTRMVSGSADKTICVWNAQDGGLVAGPFTDPDRLCITSVAFSPDGARIVSGSDKGAICVRNAHDGEVMVGPLKGHTISVIAVAFSPDSMHIVSGSNSKTICVWNVQDGTLAVGPLKGHTDAIRSVAFSPDGMHIVSGSWDGTIFVWSVQDGKLVADPFKGHTDCIGSVVFSTDGSHILSVSHDYCIHSTGLQNTDLPSSTLQGDWDVKDSGWVVNRNGQRLFWVPPQIRPFLPRLYTSYVVCPEGTLQIDYSNLLLGDSWDQCYIGG